MKFRLFFVINKSRKIYSESQENSEHENADNADVSTICRLSRLSSVSSNCLAQADENSRIGQEDRTDRDSIVSSPARLSSFDG